MTCPEWHVMQVPHWPESHISIFDKSFSKSLKTLFCRYYITEIGLTDLVVIAKQKCWWRWWSYKMLKTFNKYTGNVVYGVWFCLSGESRSNSMTGLGLSAVRVIHEPKIQQIQLLTLTFESLTKQTVQHGAAVVAERRRHVIVNGKMMRNVNVKARRQHLQEWI